MKFQKTGIPGRLGKVDGLSEIADAATDAADGPAFRDGKRVIMWL